MKSKLKKILASFLTAAMAISILPFTAFENEKVSAAVTNYLKDEDIITISPAESNPADGWSLCVQNNSYSDGSDVHMWQNGESCKFRVWHYNKNDDATGAFWLHAVTTTEGLTSKFVDVEGRSDKDGANIHLWKETNNDKEANLSSSSKWLQLEKDNDEDPTTFYIKNVRANKYLAPENYFSGKSCFENGVNTVLSSKEFSWKINILTITPGVAGYLEDTDIITISPGENRTVDDNGNDSGHESLFDANGWSLTVQDNNVANGNDLQMWQYGVSDKLRVWHYNKNDRASGAFWLCAVDWSEIPSKRFVDVEGRSVNSGANIHVWSQSSDDDKNWEHSSKWFQLVDDGDSDPETFYIKNVNSGKYLAPENYFNTKKDYNGRQCLSEGKNTVLSDQGFSWKIEVLNRTPDSVKSQREWMKNIDGSIPLSAINIPGTHDACTANVQTYSSDSLNWAKCQKLFIREQLEVGIRSFDLRMKYKDGKLIMLHGSNDGYVCHTEGPMSESTNMKFEEVMEYYKDYLEKHPSETIIVTFKNDGGNYDQTVEEFRKVLDKYNKTDNNGNTINTLMYDWDTLPEGKSVPTLDQVRGKVVAFSRLSDCFGGIYGPNLSHWDERYDSGDNKEGQLITNQNETPKVYVQDHYMPIEGTKTKIEYVMETVKYANNDDEVSKLYEEEGLSKSDNPSSLREEFLFNYTSCTFPPFMTPVGAAAEINQFVRDRVYDPSIEDDEDFTSYFAYYIIKKERLGIVMMDFADAQLAKIIYQSNGTYGGNSEEYIDSLIKGTSDKSSAVSNYASAKAVEDNTSVYNGENFTLKLTWPTVDPLMYGYSLADAGIKDGSATITLSDGSEYVIGGEFVFKDSAVYPSVSDSDSTLYTLTFVPLNSRFPVLEKDVTINVIKRPLDIKIGAYKQQYGDTAESWRDVVSVLGRVAEKDWDQLSAIDMVIEKDGVENTIDIGGNITIADILSADLPVGSTGSVSVKYGDKTAADFPNYDMNVQAGGTWEIVPRQVTIEWSGQSHYLAGDKVNITANIGNIYNNEDVNAVVRTVQGKTVDGVTEYTSTAYLEGADAANYEIPDYLSTFTYTLSAAAKVITEPTIRLSETSFVYDGTAKTPEISVYDDGVLIPSDEYTVEYSNNIKSGLASVTITDKTGGHYDFVFYDKDGNETNATTISFIIESNGSAEYISGDISKSNQIDLYDAVIISQYLLGMVEFGEEEIIIADYNGDGDVNIYDAVGIAQYLLDNLQK